MIAGYHTHTTGFGHAYGTEREFEEYALKALGFSDRTACDLLCRPVIRELQTKNRVPDQKDRRGEE